MAAGDQAFASHVTPALLRRGKALYLLAVTGLKTLRHQPAHRLPQHVVAGIAKDVFGRGIEALDALRCIDDDEGVLRQIEDRRHQR